MKQQMEVTLKSRSGYTITFWMGIASDEPLSDECQSEIGLLLRDGTKSYATDCARRCDAKIVHMRGPFDVPEDPQ